MLYNISSWTLKELKDFTIPLAALQGCFLKILGYSPSGTEVEIDLGAECQDISGTLINNTIHVKSFKIYGDGSGYIYNYICKPIFKASKGYLKALVVFEGGDSINILKIGRPGWITMPLLAN